MNFLARWSRVRGFAFAVVIWAGTLLACDREQNNQPVRSPDTPVLIWDIDLKLANDPLRNWRTTLMSLLRRGQAKLLVQYSDCVICGHRAAANLLRKV